jgi:hypothetical protein
MAEQAESAPDEHQPPRGRVNLPALFGGPQMLDSAATAGRALLRLGIDTPGSGRWEGM